MWTVLKLLKETQSYFAGKHIRSARLDAELLLGHCLGKSRVQLYLDYEQPVGDDELSAYREMVRRRGAREPVAYITGEKEFWSLPFAVNPSVLIPRPETEILVQEALSILSQMRGPARLLEIGVGSGAVCISLAVEIRTLAAVGTDISMGAIETASRNAARHGVSERICFVLGQGLEWCRQYPYFDIIVSNPPYIPAGDLQSLAPDIRLYEPRIALDGGKSGLMFYQTNIHIIAAVLRSGGWAALEIGCDQAPDVTGILSDARCFHNIGTIKDYAGCDRVVIAQKK